METLIGFEAGQPVVHARHGRGRVIAAAGATTVVRFEGAIEQVLTAELSTIASLETTSEFGDPLDAITRAQALAIRSINDQWGVFTRSRVQLLPHQLWVCQKVTQQWPFRWLIADDVGLGKTIEAGLILMPLLASGRVKRVLVLAPAKLVPQWQKRLHQMFDIRFQRYAPEIDTANGDFWATSSMVVASYHTLRADRRQARTRLLEADPWDLVIVDEAHHLGMDERSGQTLGYQLVDELQQRRKINSLLFFTATPHRGKDYGFFGLMRLVRPDLFDPEKDALEQLQLLPRVLIRNNKATVTDLHGRALFTPVHVTSREYGYAPAEERFYRTLSEFIIDGRAYAATLDGRAQTARMLVLITLQKLAASSLAAIRSALSRRRASLAAAVARGEDSDVLDIVASDDAELDDIASAEDLLPSEVAVLLMTDEIARIEELLKLADDVEEETKIVRLLTLIGEELPADEPVLLFTEYKATQALVINALHRRFGPGCATFINGDERLEGIELPSGKTGTQSVGRDDAAGAFNEGRVRFLVSTEAGGEGIDLQERCATLVHVDMPWNPMRLHQRVGRVSRYGQKRPVSVFILRNPETVEARIWDLLNAKLERIQAALSSSMAEHEDISQLVIGMAGNSVFNVIFGGAPAGSAESLKQWFDAKSATIGGRDVVQTVKDLLGNVTRFDFQQIGQDLPKVDLPDLESFVINALSRHGRRVFRRPDGLEVKAPEEWQRQDYAILDRYEGLIFDRNARGKSAPVRVLGVGHRLFDTALTEALDLPVSMARVSGVVSPLLIASIEDEVTGTGASIRRVIVGATCTDADNRVLSDWELLQLLNELSAKASEPLEQTAAEEELCTGLEAAITARLPTIANQMQRPRVWRQMLLVPGAY